MRKSGANLSKMSPSKRRWRRALRWLGAVALGALAASVALVLLLRFVPLPFSALMIERRITSWFAPGTYRSAHVWVPLHDMAPGIGVAVIAAEDQNFPNHFGFDWKAIAMAAEHNEHGGRTRGASTLSQQTAKNVFLWSSRSWLRKGCEAYFTLLIETLWHKRRILEVYLNSVEFGDGIFGVEAAARTYFGKPARWLSPDEAALLAAVLPNPHRFKVAAPSRQVLEKREWILRQMRLLGGEQVLKNLQH
jgi:monofunctional biosynthetic peptidoglycan transglycosylase